MILGKNTSLVPIDLVVNVGAAELALNITCGAVNKVFTVKFVAVAVPVNAGLAKGAFKLSSVAVAVDTGLAASLVLSTLPKLTIAFEIPPTVPVKVGLLIGALAANALVIVVA